jgi:hypothetical protein
MLPPQMKSQVFVLLACGGFCLLGVDRCPAADKQTPLEAALHKALAAPAKFAEIMDPVVDENVTTVAEARLLIAKLRTLPSDKVEPPTDPPTDSPLLTVATFFQQVDSQAALDELTTLGIPQLCRVFEVASHNSPDAMQGDLLFVLKILGMYQTTRGTEVVLAAANKGFASDDDFWSVILAQFDSGHPDAKRVMEQFGNRLPSGNIGVGLLDAANDLALDGVEFHHPFDSIVGIDQLKTWLSSSDKDDFDVAVSAAASLPFLKNPLRNDLIQLALGHPDPYVEIEGGWAAAKNNDSQGIEVLVRWSSDARYSKDAIEYLEELNRGDAIPEKSREPAFAAMAAMCRWLSDPDEMGRAPDAIEQVDSRELFWPPTGDRRTVYLFRYRYDSKDADVPGAAGLGMVGSVTFALFGEDLPTLKPAEAYALHCCWELQRDKNPLAPQERSVAAGLKLLSPQNPALADN